VAQKNRTLYSCPCLCNRSIFGKDMDKSIVCGFLGLPVDFNCSIRIVYMSFGYIAGETDSLTIAGICSSSFMYSV